jgi:hypothetical protein
VELCSETFPRLLKPWAKVAFCVFLLTSNSFVLYMRVSCCYTYSRIEIMSTQNDYQHCLQKLATMPPRRKAALVRSLLPGIEAALISGQTLKDIWQALETEGLDVSYHTFQMAVWRAKRKRTANSGWGKKDDTSEPFAMGKREVEAVEARDPLANLKRLEENRPGFQWRGTQKLRNLVHGTEGSNDKDKR